MYVNSYSSSSTVNAYTTYATASNATSNSGSSGSSVAASNTTNTTPAAEYTPSGATSASATYSKPTVRCGIASSSGSSSSTGASSSSTGVSSSSTGGASSSTGSSSVSDASSPGTYNAAAHSGKTCDETNKEKDQNTNNANTTNSSNSADNNNSSAAVTTNQNAQTNLFTDAQIDQEALAIYNRMLQELNGSTGESARVYVRNRYKQISKEQSDHNDSLGIAALPKAETMIDNYLSPQVDDTKTTSVISSPITNVTPTKQPITEKIINKIQIETLDDYNNNQAAQNGLISDAKTEFENAQNNGNQTDMQTAHNQAEQARLNGGTIANDNDYKSIIDGQISILNDTKQKYSSAKSSNDTTKMNNLYAVESTIRGYLSGIGTYVSIDNDPNDNPTTKAESLFQSMLKYMKDNNISGDSAVIYTRKRMEQYHNDVKTYNDPDGPAVEHLVNDMLDHFDFTTMKPIDSTDNTNGTDTTNDVKPVKVKAVISKDVQDSIANSILSNMGDEIDEEASYLASESNNINNDDFSQDDYEDDYQVSQDYLMGEISNQLDDMWDSVSNDINYIQEDGTKFSGQNYTVENDIKDEITTYISNKAFASLDSSVNEMTDDYSDVIDGAESDVNTDDENIDNTFESGDNNDTYVSTTPVEPPNYSSSPTAISVQPNNNTSTTIIEPVNHSTSPTEIGVPSNNSVSTTITEPANSSTSSTGIGIQPNNNTSTTIIEPANYSTSPTAIGVLSNNSVSTTITEPANSSTSPTAIGVSSNNNVSTTIVEPVNGSTSPISTGMTSKKIQHKSSSKVKLYGYCGKNHTSKNDPEIIEIKRMLSNLDYKTVQYDGAPENVYSAQTYSAVKTFQTTYMGLKNPSGVVGPLTLKCLKECNELKRLGEPFDLDQKKKVDMLDSVILGIADGVETTAKQITSAMIYHKTETLFAIALACTPIGPAVFTAIGAAATVKDVINAVNAPTTEKKTACFTQAIIDGLSTAACAKGDIEKIKSSLADINMKALKSVVKLISKSKSKIKLVGKTIVKIGSKTIEELGEKVKKLRRTEEKTTNMDNTIPGGTNNSTFRFSEMSEEEISKIVNEYREKAPFKIPKAAKARAQSKDGYEQISYKWNDGTYKYEERWHTRTPDAPKNQGNTWVIQRTKPGSGGVKPTTEFKIGVNEWISGYKWYDAIAARKAGTATPEQIRILDKGHWKE